MSAFSIDPVELSVEHRNAAPGGGPTLRVRRASDRREVLRFDCFEHGGHWHLDPDGADEITSFDPDLDNLEWTIAALRNDLAGWLARAGIDAKLDAADAGVVLDAVESALRNPPVDLDGVRPAMRRPSLGEKWSTYPEEVLPAWVADMDFPVAEPVRRVLQRAVERSDLGYPIHPAPTDVPALTVARMQRLYGWQVEPRQVEILTDVVQGMYVSLHQFTELGDGVVVQTPIYAPFLGCVRSMRRRLVENRLSLGPEGYTVDLDGLRAAADEGTRVLLLCNPHNPSGRVFRRDELEGIAEVALSRDLVVVTDEIHQDIVYSGHRHIPFATLSPEVEARTLTLTAASKAFNVAGLRCGVAIFGSADLARRFRALPRHIRGGISMPGIEALQAAWRHAGPWLDQVLPYLESNRDFVTAFVRDRLPGIRCHPPEATYLAWLDCRELELPPDPHTFFLERGQVGLSNGTVFGDPGDGFVRLNFGTSRAILTDALERMAKALATV